MSGGILLQMVSTFNCCENSTYEMLPVAQFSLDPLRSPFVGGSEEGRTAAYDAMLLSSDVTGKRKCYKFVTIEMKSFLLESKECDGFVDDEYLSQGIFLLKCF